MVADTVHWLQHTTALARLAAHKPAVACTAGAAETSKEFCLLHTNAVSCSHTDTILAGVHSLYVLFKP